MKRLSGMKEPGVNFSKIMILCGFVVRLAPNFLTKKDTVKVHQCLGKKWRNLLMTFLIN
jgi:hypothetical protein